MASAQLQSISTMLITIDSIFSFTPLDSNGNIISGGRVLYWPEVFEQMTFVPKNAIANGPCVGCLPMPFVSSRAGFDGFSVPISKLFALSPAYGYAFTCAYSFTLRGQASQNSLAGHHKKMTLQTVVNATTDPGFVGTLSGAFIVTQTITVEKDAPLTSGTTLAVMGVAAAIITVVVAASILFVRYSINARKTKGFDQVAGDDSTSG
jgi:hypothetical protein